MVLQDLALARVQQSLAERFVTAGVQQESGHAGVMTELAHKLLCIGLWVTIEDAPAEDREQKKHCKK